ncbi:MULTISPECIES: alpha-ketoacid dehydrogenase subunit beta [Burkholderia]|uniref:alpha-ketoacid dehydrogenase subunit beta n=1 Tax=Burkholderia TaxID=32008 RepID=UPI000F571BD7|nr:MULTISPECIES: alpha-ketoacid dehydrogenase subunit beta [Burkholderia]ELK6462011.1 alpha-ketoacid dehydrogenase subunit beta [Burkholderia contaminans]MBN3835403.1 alpha-ketoacid dehydrogenase subunit beta [Burkholderia sp. Ac-20344]MCA7889303.1 alpha-ketoacid dehydrogenase subunit beta [Burkholderia contaminans]RQT35596.1 alpha-ketoacid dehydrogenase subunit beta [Burkholderia contaminans]
MAKKSFRQALNDALHSEMARDPRVIMMGEDLTGGAGANGVKDAWGGAFGVTRGLLDAYGPERIRDTPISEAAFVGAAAGAALTGLRPIAELMFVDFAGVCLDQIMNQIAKFRYMFGGHAKTPLVIRATYGAGTRSAAQHTQAFYPIFTHIPGLKVVIPSNPYDAKGLLLQAIRDDDPVIFLENKMLYDTTGEVPDGAYTIPFGEARVVRDGKDVLIVALGRMVGVAEAAARTLAADGVSACIIDPRTTSPLDEDTLIEYTEDIGRVVIVDEANPRCSVATDISALLADKCFDSLKAPIRRVTAPHTPVPYAPNLEDAYVPSPEAVVNAVKSILKR